MYLNWMWLWASLVTISLAKKPNILFILTDDQDWHMNSLAHMPLLQKYMINEGTVYANHFCTIALCCPSRVNLWTGRAAHNTNVTDVWAPYGGYPKVVREGINDNYIFTWMQDAGYNTYYTGKLWNHHSVDNYNSPYAGGFNGSDFILDPTTYEYYNASMSRNGGAPVSYAGKYSPDITAEKAYDFLDEATMHDEPFFLTVAPVAPHGNIKLSPFHSDMPKYADRHAHLFKDYKIPRTEDFNPEVQGGVGWIAQLPRLNDTVIAYNDEYQRARLRALQSVDEMVENLVKMLDKKGILDNTYIFYTTDNGYHISQHRMHPGKECSFDTDIHIPLIVRGPGVAPGKTLDIVTSHTDLSPTIMEIVGKKRDDFDGAPIPFNTESASLERSEHINIEFWGVGIPEGIFGFNGSSTSYENTNVYRNNTYKSLRLIGNDYSLLYSVWCTNVRELYDVQADPGQLHNLYGDKSLSSKFSIAGRQFPHVVSRLDALMMVLKSCKAQACIDPWNVLHPEGDVKSLADALNGRFDAFYEEQPKVSFTKCEMGYIRESEGPQEASSFKEGYQYRQSGEGTRFGLQKTFKYEGHWSLWV